MKVYFTEFSFGFQAVGFLTLLVNIRFIDITESIQEVKHMESLRIEDSLEEMREEKKENQKSPLTATRKLSSSLHNLSISKENNLKTSER